MDSKQFFLDIRERVATFGKYAKLIQGSVTPRNKLEETHDPAITALTDADIIVENGILEEMIKQGYNKKFSIGTEENSPYAKEFLKKANFHVEIDPIDGTLSYKYGLPLWCIVLSTYNKGELEGIMVYTPLDEKFYGATRTEHSWIWEKNKKGIYSKSKLNMKVKEGCENILLTHQMSEEEIQKLKDKGFYVNPVEKPGKNGYPYVGLNSLFRGEIGGYLKRHAPARDWGSMSLIVEKGGGVVTNYEGNDKNIYDYFCEGRTLKGTVPSIIASGNKTIHQKILTSLNS